MRHQIKTYLIVHASDMFNAHTQRSDHGWKKFIFLPLDGSTFLQLKKAGAGPHGAGVGHT